MLACPKCGIAIPGALVKRGEDTWGRDVACHRCRSIFAVEVRCLREGEKLAEVIEADKAAVDASRKQTEAYYRPANPIVAAATGKEKMPRD